MAARLGFPPAALLALAALAGCLGSEDGVPDHLLASGSGPVFCMDRYAYEGDGIVEAEGAIEIDATESAALGRVTATIEAAGLNVTRYGPAEAPLPVLTVDWTRFIGDPSRPFQQQGIAHDLQEHGASGAGDTNLPEMHVLSAGWGTANVTLGQAAIIDPATGLPGLVAHYMVTDTGVWEDATRRVLAGNGTGPYSPANPADGVATDGDAEIHLILRSDPSVTIPPDPEPVTDQFTFINFRGPPAGSKLLVVEVPTATLDVVVRAVEDAPATVSPGQANVTILDPDGEILRAATLGGLDQRLEVVWEEVPVRRAGNHSIFIVQETGAGRWAVEGRIDYPEPVFLYCVFETATWRAP